MSIDTARDILQKINYIKDTNRQRPEEWRVQVHMAVEDILERIKLGKDILTFPFPDITKTQHFYTLEKALEHAFIVKLEGHECDIINNHTGDIYGRQA